MLSVVKQHDYQIKKNKPIFKKTKRVYSICPIQKFFEVQEAFYKKVSAIPPHKHKTRAEARVFNII